MNHPPILLIDDNPDWLFLIRNDILKAGIYDSVIEARDGDAAIKILKRALLEGELPLFILLDINMPRVDGLQVLHWIRGQPPLHEVPVLMLSSSREEADIQTANERGADAYFIKGGNVSVFALIYSRANRIYEGMIKRFDAFSHLPGNLLLSEQTRKTE